MTWYDPLKDHTGPEVVMNMHLPAICRTFWGEKIAPAMVEFFSSGVLPVFLSNPGKTVDGWNRIWKNAMYDPTGGSMGSSGNLVPMPPVVYNAELVNGQVVAAEKAVKALERAERIARAGSRSGGDAQSAQREKCVAEAGVCKGRRKTCRHGRQRTLRRMECAEAGESAQTAACRTSQRGAAG